MAAKRTKAPKVQPRNKLGENKALFEWREGEKAARIFEDLLLHPEKAMKEIAASEGVPPHIVQHINERLGTHFYQYKNAAQAVKKSQLRPLVEHRLHVLLDSLSDEEIKKASPYQRTLMAGILFDKLQLLEGKPTQITEVQQGDKATRAVTAALEELQRRGIAPRDAIDLEEDEEGHFS